MRTAACFAVGLLVSAVWRADGATLYLANPFPDETQGETSGSLVLAPGESGTMNIMLEISGGDPANVAFINAFLDEVGDLCDVDVTAITHGLPPPFIYDTSAFALPADIGDDCNPPDDEVNEYGLVFGDQTVGGGLPPGFTTWVIDSLTLTHTGGAGVGEIDVYFEGGARKPQAFGPAPTYTPFTTNDFLCIPIFGLLNMGVGNYTPGCSDAFDITIIPEPAALSLLIFGCTVIVGRRTMINDKLRTSRIKK